MPVQSQGTIEATVFDIAVAKIVARVTLATSALQVSIGGQIFGKQFESPTLWLDVTKQGVSWRQELGPGTSISFSAGLVVARGVVSFSVSIDSPVWSRAGSVEIPYVAIRPTHWQLLPPTASTSDLEQARAAAAGPKRRVQLSTKSDAGLVQALRGAFGLAGIPAPSIAFGADQRRLDAALGVRRLQLYERERGVPADFLIALGFGVEFGLGVDLAASSGEYWTSDGETGIYGSGATGYGVVASASLGIMFSMFWGGKHSFEGECESAVISAGEGIVGGVELFWTTASFPVPVGVTFMLGVGVGLPVDVAVHVSYTYLQSLRTAAQSHALA